MKDLLKTYKEVVESIFEKFGIIGGYGDIEDKTNEKWNYTKESVCWEDGECELYVYDIRKGPSIYENFALFWVDDHFGGYLYQIYDMNIRNENLTW